MIETMPNSKNMASQHDPVRAFRIPDRLYSEFREAAADRDLNLSQAVRRAIAEWIESRSN